MLSLTQSEDIITGAANPFVLVDETYRLANGFSNGFKEFQKEVKNALFHQAGIETKDMLSCSTLSQNDTVLSCPVSAK